MPTPCPPVGGGLVIIGELGCVRDWPDGTRTPKVGEKDVDGLYGP